LFGGAFSNVARIAMPERLANRLKDRRAELGFTQAELAEKVGVTRKTVNTVENGVFTPSATLAIKLARALELSVEDLFWIER
jgi:putative transcriptional regulator